MLFCKGKGCNWRKVCSRYVLGRGIAARTDISAEWVNHCLRHQDKFIAINSEEGRRVAAAVSISSVDGASSTNPASPILYPCSVPEASPSGEERRPQW